MRKQFMLSMGAAVLAGAVGGALLSPAPLGAVAKEIVELLAGVNQLQQGQRDMQSSIDTKMTEMRTLVQQETDNSNKLDASINGMHENFARYASQQFHAAFRSFQQRGGRVLKCHGVAGTPDEDEPAAGGFAKRAARNRRESYRTLAARESHWRSSSGNAGAPGNMPATDPGMNPAAQRLRRSPRPRS